MRSETRRLLGPLRQAKWTLGSTQTGVRVIAHLQGYGERLVTDKTDIVIDGFPRSGNSLFTNYVKLNNPNLRLAHHVHMVGQFTIARRYEIPAALLIRNPQDAVASLCVADPTLGAERATKWWVYFYSCLIVHRNRLLVLPFDKLVSNPRDSAFRLSEFAGTQISAPEYDQSVRERLHRLLVESRGYQNMPNLIPVPTAKKERLKAEIKESVATCVNATGAREVYDLFTSAAN